MAGDRSSCVRLIGDKQEIGRRSAGDWKGLLLARERRWAHVLARRMLRESGVRGWLGESVRVQRAHSPGATNWRAVDQPRETYSRVDSGVEFTSSVELAQRERTESNRNSRHMCRRKYTRLAIIRVYCRMVPSTSEDSCGSLCRVVTTDGSRTCTGDF